MEACNGCGLCCHLELCPAGGIAYPEAKAPCPALVIHKGRTWCGLVIAEQGHPELKPLIQISLGIGKGCTMKDDELT